MVVTVTPATSISSFRPELDDFLQAPIVVEGNEMPLSVLSALARMGLDPWKEAGDLCGLPTESATRRLAALIVRLPGERWTQAEADGIALRLIKLLPSREVASPDSSHGRSWTAVVPSTRMLICAALVAIALFNAASCNPSSGADVLDQLADTVPNPAQ
jgi:hypothetical protein